jgi:holo-[acyl-carrier protein] synthase
MNGDPQAQGPAGRSGIIGLGVDLVPISRMRALLNRHGDRLERKLFTERERAYAHSRPRPEEHLAARFAAKEAALKALCVPEGLRWHELEVVTRARAPELVFHGAAAEAARARGVHHLHLSLTHAGDTAVAVVVLEA